MGGNAVDLVSLAVSAPTFVFDADDNFAWPGSQTKCFAVPVRGEGNQATNTTITFGGTTISSTGGYDFSSTRIFTGLSQGDTISIQVGIGSVRGGLAILFAFD